ncbi:hypothetical protein M758_3G179600, partial [Ceratodon purpureus]
MPQNSYTPPLHKQSKARPCDLHSLGFAFSLFPQLNKLHSFWWAFVGFVWDFLLGFLEFFLGLCGFFLLGFLQFFVGCCRFLWVFCGFCSLL